MKISMVSGCYLIYLVANLTKLTAQFSHFEKNILSLRLGQKFHWPSTSGILLPQNYCCRMHRNAPFRDKNSKHFLGRGHSPLPDPSPLVRGHPVPKPHPVGACGADLAPHSPTLNPPLIADTLYFYEVIKSDKTNADGCCPMHTWRPQTNEDNYLADWQCQHCVKERELQTEEPSTALVYSCLDDLLDSVT